MSKFAIECPKCSSVNTASNFIFAKKVIQCGTCGEEINVSGSRLISKTCPKCEKVFVYDQAKPKKRNCPSCGEPINPLMAATAEYKFKKVTCPQCTCETEIDSSKEFGFCPICDYKINVKQAIEKANLVSDSGISVIKYEGDNSTFVWKHPIEDFNLGSQLIVHESQEAVFFLNGKSLDLFGPGKHTLETENLPELKKVNKFPTDQKTPFHAEVYFINKTVQMGLKWGTDTRVSIIDPITNIPLDIGASGEMNLQVSDSRKLLIKLVGTSGGLTSKEVLFATSDSTETVHKSLQSYFRAPLVTEIKSYLATVIKQEKVNIFEIDEKLSTLSEKLRERISPKFEEYGLLVPQFYITTIDLPEEDKNFKAIKSLTSQAYLSVKEEEVKTSVAEVARQRQIVEEQTKAQLEIIRAQGIAEAEKAKGIAEAEVMQAKGYNQMDVLQTDVQKEFAKGIGQMGSNGGSGGSGGIMSDFVGLGVGMAAMGTMGKKVGDVMKNIGGEYEEAENQRRPSSGWNCPCGCENIIGNFCAECGRPKPEKWDCVNCGAKGNLGKFCYECGAAKALTWVCPHCGATGNRGKFCYECGGGKDLPETWDCDCGNKNNTGKACTECGKKREDKK